MGKALNVSTAVKLALLSCAPWIQAQAATLPVPCIGGACGKAASGFVSSGKATAVQSGPKLTVTQGSSTAVLDWQSFNISQDGAVQFVQPTASAVALNQIFDSNPTQILGALSANGRVFLINQNGIVFGATAQVNVGGLLASTLSINPSAVTSGLIAPGSTGQPALQAFSSGATGTVSIAQGASLQTGQGGEILIFAPQISNQGTISTPGGQTLLAAGSTIYLASSTDPNLRGLLVEVGDTGGTVTNGTAGNSSASPDQLIGQITAADGNVTLAGLAVNQLGRVSATTSINENGSITLQATDHGSISQSGATGVSGTLVEGSGGQLVLGAQSVTGVTLDSTDPSVTVDSVPQPKSSITMAGNTIQMLGGSLARATSGTIAITAEQAPNEAPPSNSDGSRFYMAPGAELDVSGADVVLPVSSNVIAVELRGTELANSPLQQNGPLRGQTVYVDIRQDGPLVDGLPSWQGTPLADVSGEIAAIGHNVLERNLTGGTISIQSHGDAILAPGSTVDVAGGEIQYTAGYVNTTNLITTTGQIVNIANANPNILYSGIANTATASDPKWGTSSTYTVTPGTYTTGYVEGKDAGTVQLSAPNFIFDATANTATVMGPYQRNPDLPLPTGQLYRDPNQLPDAATLMIGQSGSDFVVGNVTVAPGLVLPGLTNADGTAFDPLTDPLPATFTTSMLRPDLLGLSGFGNVSLYTNGRYVQPAGTDLEFPAGGSFSVNAGLVDIEGSILAPGGSITAVADASIFGQGTAPAYTLSVGPQAVLSTDGEWVNDSALLNPAGNTAPLVINGGSISLQAVSSNNQYSPGVQIAAGSLIDVSGGGQYTAAGKMIAGVGGSISIGAETQSGTLAGAPAHLDLAGTLRGYGISEGGSLALTSGAVCVAAAACSGGDPAQLWVSPAELASGGFSSYSLSANQGGLDIAPGTGVILQQQNFVLPADASRIPNQSSLTGLATVQLLTDQLRQPVNLILNQAEPATQDFGTSTILSGTGSLPSLIVGEGALIQGDPGASISLTSNIRIEVNGTIRAPGGSIALNLDANLSETSYDPTQGIWLDRGAVLDAAGTTRIYPNGLGRPSGTVLNGGDVSLTANRGFIELQPGSLINVSGSSGVVDVTGANGIAQAEQVASAGGALSLTAAESIELSGTLEAAAGTAGPGQRQPAGGSFSLTLDGSNRDAYVPLGSGGGPAPFANNPRQILISATQPQVVIGLGTPLPSALDGYAYVATEALSAAGFDSVNLKAAPLPYVDSNTGQNAVAAGNIDFQGNVTLRTGGLITLDSASYAVAPGALAQVQAPYIEFGDSDQVYNVAPTATPGTGTLDVSGGFIGLYGTSSLQGIGSAAFTSTGDLRLRGLLNLGTYGATQFNGGLNAAGNIVLSAQQIYPATLSQFVISADPNSVTNPMSGSIAVVGSPGSNTELLSAGGALTLSAGTITQDGTLRAPFGTIDLVAQSVTLGPNSLTSTSADGQTIPFGTTQGGLDWVYPLPNNTSMIYGTDGVAPPSQQVTLQGAQVNVQGSAVINVSGGGDLQAYEWIPGTGGTNDVLSQSVRPDQFAILPGAGMSVAPFDSNISNGSTLQVGQAVYLSGLPGLPAGVYQLLPARYALLPGAYLVSQVSGYQDIQNGQSYAVPGGGTIIAGYNTLAGTSFADSRTSGFDVVPASVVLQQAQYTTTSGNQFFASQAASALVAPPRLPQDSGVLALIASNALTLNGTLNTTSQAGLGAEVDISSANILVGSASSTVQPGQILLSPTSLDALGAQTLLLGGLRTGDTIDTTAQTVEVSNGANLTAPLVLVAAQNQINVDSGASITATGTAPQPLSFALSGDGAFLAVSAGLQNTVTRTNTAGVTGVLNMAPGSTLAAAGGAVYLEASSNVVTDGNLSLTGSDLAVQSPQIILGTAPSGFSGTVLGPNTLGAEGLRNLLLESVSNIEIFGSVNASAQNITIYAPGLSGFGLPSDVATFAATDSLTLGNPQGSAANPVGAGSGTLNFTAPTITLAGGILAADGFGAVGFTAQNTFTAAANAAFATVGNLIVTAPSITTGNYVDLTLAAGGAVSLQAPAAAATASASNNLGGSLSVTGSSVAVAIPIDLPSGLVSLTSTGGDIDLQSGGSIDTAGLVQTYDGVNVASPGGTVSLTSAGNVLLGAGTLVDVSAGSGGAGGSLSISAPTGMIGFNGALKGSGASGMGGAVSIDAQGFGDFGALTQLLGAGGFSGSQALRLRGPGDLVLASGSTITANQVSLEADQGGIVIDGNLDASGAQSGAVTLAASGNVVLNGGIDAQVTGAGQAGGTVDLETTNGQLLLNPGSRINVAGGSGASGGTVLLRVPAVTVTGILTGGTGVALDGTIAGSSRTTLEGFNGYANTTGVISATDTAAEDSNPLYADAAAFMSNADAITKALGQTLNAAFVVAPGVEIDATTQSNGSGTLELDTAWNLYNWRFGDNDNVPGILTLRAQNGITFNASLSDGFAASSGTGAFTLPTQATDSWSYRIAAGADFSAANPLTVSSANPADVTIAACVTACTVGTRYAPIMVRTGDGFIDVNASGDFVLGSQQSVLYTAGVAGAGVPLPGRAGTLQGLAYPTDGGNIQIHVVGNVVGAPTNQFVNDWLWRVGSPPDSPNGSATAWTVDFQGFQQGIGALAGGNVSVVAGGDITNLSAVIPTIGVPQGGTTLATSTVQVHGGGNLDVVAGGSILGGSYYVGSGSATLQAGADVGAISASDGGTGLSPLIGMGDATLDVTARGNLQLSEIVNPTLLGRGQLQGSGQTVYFSTYGADSTVNLTAVGGNVVFNDDNESFFSAVSASFLGQHVTDTSNSLQVLDILPPSLNIYALSGDVDFGRTLALTPSTQGNLQVFANHNVVATVSPSGSGGQLILSDADPTQLPSPAAPQSTLQIYEDIDASLSTPLPDQHAPVPVYLAQDQSGLTPVRVVALNGNVDFQPESNGSLEGIWSAKPVEIVAGGSIQNLNLVAQNLGPSDVTSVIAGGDISYLQQRDAFGNVVQDLSGITVDGPGQLQVSAGGNVDLGTSSGISTRANLVNSVLPAGGASIAVQAGVSGDNEKYASFIAQYVQGSDQFDSELTAFVQIVTGQSGLGNGQAKQEFGSLSPQLQQAFVQQLFFALLRYYGRQEAATGNGDFSGAFAAISTLFPGANPNLAAGQTNPYAGNIELYFSRIYTEQGGDISMLAPGGSINVGLALAPASFGINKAPDQLGIVAQTSGSVNAFSYSDFEVNQSRVFAADGGNILVWSTEGNIDAGRGAKTSISAPALNVVYDSNGQPTVSLRAAIAGSGIQALAATSGILPGDVDLFAPHGVVNANDAGIVAGNLTIAATAVLGSSNISVSGTAVGVPVTVTGVGASFAGASSAAGSTTNAAESTAAEARSGQSTTPAADAAVSFLDVFVTGLGEENCKPDDVECLKRQKSN